MEALQSLFHLGCGIFYIVGMYFDLQVVTDHIMTYGGRWKYLTFLDLFIQLAYFVIAPLGDFVTLVKGNENNWIVKLRDVLFASLAFPLGVFVSASFWGIYMMNRELIFPRVLDKVIPPWLNHLLHTWCAVLIILEGAFVRHQYPKNRVGVGLLAAFALIYLLWISWIAYVAEFWVYPFLRILPNSARAVFFTLSAFVLVFFYFLGKWMTFFIWGTSEEKKDNSTVKSKEGKKKVKKVE